MTLLISGCLLLLVVVLEKFWCVLQIFIFVVHSTVVEQATHMLAYAGSSPTSIDHRKELI